MPALTCSHSRLADSSGACQAGLQTGSDSTLAIWRVLARRSYWDVLFNPGSGALFPVSMTDFPAASRGGQAGQPHSGRRSTPYSGRDRVKLRDLEFAFANTASVAEEVGADEESDLGWNVHWPWGNDAIGASWTHLMHGGGTLEVRGSFSRYSAEFNFTGFEGTRMFTEIDQSSLEADLELRPTPATRWKSGLVGRRMNRAPPGRQGIPPNSRTAKRPVGRRVPTHN